MLKLIYRLSLFYDLVDDNICDQSCTDSTHVSLHSTEMIVNADLNIARFECFICENYDM